MGCQLCKVPFPASGDDVYWSNGRRFLPAHIGVKQQLSRVAVNVQSEPKQRPSSFATVKVKNKSQSRVHAAAFFFLLPAANANSTSKEVTCLHCHGAFKLNNKIQTKESNTLAPKTCVCVDNRISATAPSGAVQKKVCTTWAQVGTGSCM